MFAKGATPGKVKTWCYDEDEEDFTRGKYLTLIVSIPLNNCLQMPPPSMFGHWNNLKHFFEIQQQIHS